MPGTIPLDEMKKAIDDKLDEQNEWDADTEIADEHDVVTEDSEETPDDLDPIEV